MPSPRRCPTSTPRPRPRRTRRRSSEVRPSRWSGSRPWRTPRRSPRCTAGARPRRCDAATACRSPGWTPGSPGRLLVGGSGALVVAVGDQVVGLAALGDLVEGRCELSLMVEDAWQGQGLGTRLLAAAARLAAAGKRRSCCCAGPPSRPPAVAMVFASGLRARVRLAGDELLVTVSARGLSPLPRRRGLSGTARARARLTRPGLSGRPPLGAPLGVRRRHPGGSPYGEGPWPAGRTGGSCGGRAAASRCSRSPPSRAAPVWCPAVTRRAACPAAGTRTRRCATCAPTPTSCPTPGSASTAPGRPPPR